MGCSQSKLEPDEKAPGRLRPSPVGRRRFHIRKNGAGGRKKRNFITAADLMHKEESEAGDIAGADEQYLKSPEKGAKSPKRTAEAQAKEEEIRKRKRPAVVETGEEELPGSPSFRFYFAKGAPPPKWMDNDAAGNEELKDHPAMQHHEDNFHPRDDSSKSATSSDQEMEPKSTKKDKSSKFKVLAKGSSVVYNTVLGR